MVEGVSLGMLVKRQGRLSDERMRVRDDAGGFNVAWNPATGELGGAAVGADAVVNLAGASIAEGRWTEKRKAELRSSRVDCFTVGQRQN